MKKAILYTTTTLAVALSIFDLGWLIRYNLTGWTPKVFSIDGTAAICIVGAVISIIAAVTMWDTWSDDAQR